MAYSVNFTDSVNKNPIVIDDNSRNTVDTSLTFIGRNEASYGQAIAENFLHVLENFANSTPPNNPIEGQLWFDSGTNRLKINDSTAGASNWRPAGGVHVEAVEPQNPLTGDVWVDTTNNQLYLYTGAQFQLVGPNFAGGLKAGAQAEEVVDTKNGTHTVIKNYVADKVVTIISKDQFIPRQKIEGFVELFPGINISSTDFDNNGIVLNKLHATATKADALNVTQPAIETVNANNFLRTDITDTMNGQLFVRNDGGVTVGANQIFNLEIASNNAVIKNNSLDGNIDFKVFPESDRDVVTVMRVDGRNKRVGINQVSPQVALDVTGSGHFTEQLQLAATTTSTSTSTGALIVSGGAGIAENLNVGGNAKFDGHIQVGETGSGTVAIQPTDNGNQEFDSSLDIGTTNNKFRNVYSETFTGRLVGTVVGSVFGDVNGTSDRLAASTVFKISGHVADSTGFSFDGQTGGAEKTFNVTLTQDAISSQTEITENENTDELLVVRSGQGLRKVKRTNFFAGASLVPIGAIMSYAGPITSFADIPSGYLLCDGSEVAQGLYPELFNTIGTTFGAGVNPNTFKLPDLRGRFPLGLDNMDNGTTVNDVGGVAVDAGGGVANRVTNTSARSLGGSDGSEEITTDNVAFGSGTQFTGGTGSGPYNVLNVMNPYLAVHYIIRAGEPAA